MSNVINKNLKCTLICLKLLMKKKETERSKLLFGRLLRFRKPDPDMSTQTTWFSFISLLFFLKTSHMNIKCNNNCSSIFAIFTCTGIWVLRSLILMLKKLLFSVIFLGFTIIFLIANVTDLFSMRNSLWECLNIFFLYFINIRK